MNNQTDSIQCCINRQNPALLKIFTAVGVRGLVSFRKTGNYSIGSADGQGLLDLILEGRTRGNSHPTAAYMENFSHSQILILFAQNVVVVSTLDLFGRPAAVAAGMA